MSSNILSVTLFLSEGTALVKTIRKATRFFIEIIAYAMQLAAVLSYQD